MAARAGWRLRWPDCWPFRAPTRPAFLAIVLAALSVNRLPAVAAAASLPRVVDRLLLVLANAVRTALGLAARFAGAAAGLAVRAIGGAGETLRGRRRARRGGPGVWSPSGRGAQGNTTARSAVRAGARTLLVSGGQPGGDCTFHGCVRSKTLIEAAKHGVPFGTAARRIRAVVARIAATENPAALRREGIDVLLGAVVCARSPNHGSTPPTVTGEEQPTGRPMTTATTAHGAIATTATLPSRLVAGVTGGLVGGVMFGVLMVRPRLHRS